MRSGPGRTSLYLNKPQAAGRWPRDEQDEERRRSEEERGPENPAGLCSAEKRKSGSTTHATTKAIARGGAPHRATCRPRAVEITTASLPAVESCLCPVLTNDQDPCGAIRHHQFPQRPHYPKRCCGAIRHHQSPHRPQDPRHRRHTQAGHT